MEKGIKISAIIFTVLGLISIRMYEVDLFYDPFIQFYNAYYHDLKPPQVDFSALVLNISARYWLNSILSIGLIYVLFRKRSVFRFSLFFYVSAFVVLLIIFWIININLKPDLYLTFFYVRRFLIQPIFILLLLPAFYYQRLNR
ncbi:MAG: exosortase F system-associated protein, partial [Psychroflexus sp.]|nr:exosortase F system-associated protein [Psychroflexus sp.]